MSLTFTANGVTNDLDGRMAFGEILDADSVGEPLGSRVKGLACDVSPIRPQLEGHIWILRPPLRAAFDPVYRPISVVTRCGSVVDG